MILDNTATKKEEDLRVLGPLPGRYHVMVKDVDETEALSKWESIVMTFEILAGTIPGQEGKTLREFFSVKETAAKRLNLLAMVTGLLSLGEKREVRFSEARGRQLIIEIEEQEYQGKKRARVPWAGLWRLDHPDVKDVPRDAAMTRMASQATAQPTSNAAAPATPATYGWGAI